MKLKMFFAASLFIYAALSSGCATIVKGGEGDLYLQNAPEDIEVYEDGEKLDINLMEDTQAYGFGDGFSDEMNSTNTTYYSYGVILQDPSLSRQLVLKSNSLNKETTVNVESRFRFLWFVLDLFTTGGIGIAVDALNGNWNEFSGEGDDLKYLDVMKHFEMSSETSAGN